MAYQRDILEEFAAGARPPQHPEVEVELGMVVEDRASGFCGDIVRWTVQALTLRDRHNQQRHFSWKPGGFLIDGRPVTLRRPTTRRDASVVGGHDGIDAWPAVERGVPWKEGVCRALEADADTFWPRLRNRVRTFADLRPELVGAVEQLLDFVTAG